MTDLPVGLAKGEKAEAWEAFASARVYPGALRCELVADEGMSRCSGKAVAVKWEYGFADDVCEKHAATAEQRGVLVVRIAS